MVAWIPLIYAGLSLLSAYGSMSSSKKEKKAMEEYQQKQREAAWENYRYQTRALHNRYYEEKEAASYELHNNYIKNLEAKATAKTSAAGGGVSGSTIDNLFKDYDRAIAGSQYIAKRNLHLKGLQYSDNLDSARIEAMNVINNIQPYTGASQTSLLLAGIGNAFSSYASGYRDQNYYFRNKGNQNI